ncbi:benzoylformate decarboxylase [Streptomyces sp. WMMB 714]|uniref:thiamine pyrophosphate-dependent enzyme n=1 Tax=Streptomyces sp. WMMB 714 TaxID=1286822 RepID=UPI0005F7668C|nr:thiamine pyrophosphate-dependent enzyme [Streptomyces sp. WMMB 714]SCK18883.1 benzoylformate decarboxylase [Streptomyces sp. WMMB 714]
MQTVREAALEVMRRYGLTTVFANPGSTEVPFLAGLPDDIRFVLALHEGSVVGAATGYALARDAPALALLHTTAGLGNAVGALSTARVNKAPLVVIVGQQDRRHLVQEPFLAGRLEQLAGDYPVTTETPPRAQDVPGALARAVHAARTMRGPALVIVPMDDWARPAESLPLPAPEELRLPAAADTAAAGEVAALLGSASAPALVVGAGADHPVTWEALTALAGRLDCDVWQESFGARAGFPQDHPRFAGHLPADRPRLRAVLAPYDLVLTVGAPVFRQYPYESGALTGPGTRLALVTDDPAEARRAPVELAVVARLPAFCEALADAAGADGVAEPAAGGGPSAGVAGAGRAPQRRRPRRERPAPPPPPAEGGPLRAAHVLAELARLLPPETVLVEETPSSRPDLHALVPARRPLGFLSAAMGALGFALPAAVGVRMGAPERPVVAVVGDGSSLYQIQALWTAAHYRVGVLFVVLANGRYAIMDRLAEKAGRSAPWPAFEEVGIAAAARALGCPARRVSDHAMLRAELEGLLPELADRSGPLVLEVEVAADEHFQP